MSRVFKIILTPSLLIIVTALVACQSGSDATTTRSQNTGSTATPAVEPSPSDGASRRAPGELHRTASGLQYQDLVVGTGPRPFLGQIMLLSYKGTLTDGSKFDEGVIEYNPVKERMIKGWEQGILGGQEIEPMRVGGKRKLIIPPQLGYGSVDLGKVPPDSTLIFEIELLKVRSSNFGM